MTEKLNEKRIMRILDSVYEKALSGAGPIESAYELAEKHMKEGGDRYEQANSLIRWQCAKTGTTGFLTGLGGLITLPVSVPADLISVTFVQTRMIAAIASMGGYDIKDDKVKTLVYCCMAGDGAKEMIKKLGIEFGKRISLQMIQKISGKTLTAINQKVGFRLLTKFGEKGLVNLGKGIPLVGGVIGSIFNTATTNTIGNVARNTFIQKGDSI